MSATGEMGGVDVAPDHTVDAVVDISGPVELDVFAYDRAPLKSLELLGRVNYPGWDTPHVCFLNENGRWAAPHGAIQTTHQRFDAGGHLVHTTLNFRFNNLGGDVWAGTQTCTIASGTPGEGLLQGRDFPRNRLVRMMYLGRVQSGRNGDSLRNTLRWKAEQEMEMLKAWVRRLPGQRAAVLMRGDAVSLPGDHRRATAPVPAHGPAAYIFVEPAHVLAIDDDSADPELTPGAAGSAAAPSWGTGGPVGDIADDGYTIDV